MRQYNLNDSLKVKLMCNKMLEAAKAICDVDSVPEHVLTENEDYPLVRDIDKYTLYEAKCTKNKNGTKRYNLGFGFDMRKYLEGSNPEDFVAWVKYISHIAAGLGKISRVESLAGKTVIYIKPSTNIENYLIIKINAQLTIMHIRVFRYVNNKIVKQSILEKAFWLQSNA